MPGKRAQSDPRAAELEKQVTRFFMETHETLSGAKREARAVMTARKGEEAAVRAARERLPLGGALDTALDDYETRLADEYSYIDPFGAHVGKREVMNRLRTGEGIFESFNRTALNVRVVGSVALVTNRVDVKGDLEGQDVSGSYHESHTLVLDENDQWTLVASQLTRIQEPNELFLKAVDCDAAFLSPGAEVINPPTTLVR